MKKSLSKRMVLVQELENAPPGPEELGKSGHRISRISSEALCGRCQ